MYSSGKYSGVLWPRAAANRRAKLTATIPAKTSRAGTAATRANASGRGTGTSTATRALSAGPGYPLNEGCRSVCGCCARLAVRPLERHEQAAVRALEAPCPRGRGGRHQLALEGLLTVRAHHLVALLGGSVRHTAK